LPWDNPFSLRKSCHAASISGWSIAAGMMIIKIKDGDKEVEDGDEREKRVGGSSGDSSSM
jgi:hypothetical protein